MNDAPRITAPALRRALIAGMRRVVERRDLLNKINVFPVPDGDTGSNLAFTLHTVLSGSLSRRALPKARSRAAYSAAATSFAGRVSRRSAMRADLPVRPRR